MEDLEFHQCQYSDLSFIFQQQESSACEHGSLTPAYCLYVSCWHIDSGIWWWVNNRCSKKSESIKITSKSLLKKQKKSYTKMSNRLTSIKWYLVCVSLCFIAGIFNGKLLHFLFEHPILSPSQIYWSCLKSWAHN